MRWDQCIDGFDISPNLSHTHLGSSGQAQTSPGLITNSAAQRKVLYQVMLLWDKLELWELFLALLGALVPHVPTLETV